MIGGGGIVMANFLQTIAAQDGTTIGMIPNTLVVNQLVGMAAVRYDMGKFHWIGSIMPTAHSAMVAWHASGITSIADARRAQITAGASPKGSFLYRDAGFVDEFLGTKFKIVAGYQELPASIWQWNVARSTRSGSPGASSRSRNPTWSATGKSVPGAIRPQGGRPADVPTVDELAKDEADRGPMDFLLSGNALGRPLAAPPGTPVERVEALPGGVRETMKDTRFLHDVEASRTEFGPIAGDTLQQAVEHILATPKPWIDRAKVILE